MSRTYRSDTKAVIEDARYLLALAGAVGLLLGCGETLQDGAPADAAIRDTSTASEAGKRDAARVDAQPIHAKDAAEDTRDAPSDSAFASDARCPPDSGSSPRPGMCCVTRLDCHDNDNQLCCSAPMGQVGTCYICSNMR
jgi:hypothetical protein